MRMTRFALPWSALVTLTFAAACATGRHSNPDGAPRPSWRAERDSITAQRIADEVGPRVTIRALMDHYAGSRHVEASFHMYDDAYVLVGHLDAAGRMRIVFPQGPNDDGFVRADKIYHVPSFFAGFSEEYRWRYSEYRQRYRNTASRYDSYDAGLGYVFIIASWRPMRLDRITTGDRWESYEIADVNYMNDPREAIEELAGLVAGDNREAYTIQYAHYSTTNYGNYSMAAYNRCYDPYYSSSRFGFGFGFSSFGFSPFAGFGYSPFSGFGDACGYSGYSYAYGYNWRGYAPGSVAPPIVTPPVIVPPTRGAPILHRPRFPGDTASGNPIFRRPREVATEQPSSDNAAYRRRGLVAEDATPPRRGQAIRRLPADGAGGGTTRPGLSEMMGGRLRGEPARPGGRDGYTPIYRMPADDGNTRAQGTYRTGVSRPSSDNGSPRGAVGGGSGTYSGSRPSRSEPRAVERPHPRSESPRGESGGASSAPPRAQPSAPPPAAPPRSEPSSSSGGDRRKPGH